jgi:hypothetical protein
MKYVEYGKRDVENGSRTHRPPLANQPLGVKNVVTTIEREVVLPNR